MNDKLICFLSAAEPGTEGPSKGKRMIILEHLSNICVLCLRNNYYNYYILLVSSILISVVGFTILFSFASLSRIENISIISNNAKTTVSGGNRQQLSSLLQNSE